MMAFRQAAGRHPDADSVSGCPRHSGVSQPDGTGRVNVVAPRNDNNRLPRTPHEPRSHAPNVAAVRRTVTMGANRDEVATPMRRNRKQFRGWIAVQHYWGNGSGESTAKPMDPMLEGQVRVTAKTRRAGSPRDFTTPRRDVHQEDVCARRREPQRHLCGRKAGGAEIDRDQHTARRQRTAGGDRQHRSSSRAHESERRLVAE